MKDDYTYQRLLFSQQLEYLQGNTQYQKTNKWQRFKRERETENCYINKIQNNTYINSNRIKLRQLEKLTHLNTESSYNPSKTRYKEVYKKYW